MKSVKIVSALAFFGLSLGLLLFPQQQPPLQHVTGVVNVEVPVRVYDGDRFVDSLNLSDFEVLENGVPQKVVSSYLVRKTDILRKEEGQVLQPQTSRTFYLFFQVYDYIPRLREAVSYFVKNVLGPEDDLILVTSMKSYAFKKGVLGRLSRDQIIDQMNGVVRKDTEAGNMEYRHIIEDLKRPAKVLASILSENNPAAGGPVGAEAGSWTGRLGDRDADIQTQLEEYRGGLARLENIRILDEKRIMEFARILHNVPGQKYVFLFYEREFLPQLDKKVLGHTLDSETTDVQMGLRDLFSYQARRPTIDADAIKKAYSDSSIAIHFLYLTTTPEQSPGISYEEHSEDVFTPFLEIARATGGLSESTSNPQFAMQKASEASENYYLLYYVPADYKADGKFREITVRVKGRSYRVTNRSGYFAN